MTANLENTPKSLSDYSKEEFQILLTEAKAIAEEKMQQFYEDIVSVQPIHKNEKVVEAVNYLMTHDWKTGEQTK
jgi:predicted nucleotide-binding protein (sugar kinase/HSP70/actin superfamily)